MSLIYNTNTYGPRSVPCDTTDFTGTAIEVGLSTTTVGEPVINPGQGLVFHAIVV